MNHLNDIIDSTITEYRELFDIKYEGTVLSHLLKRNLAAALAEREESITEALTGYDPGFQKELDVAYSVIVHLLKEGKALDGYTVSHSMVELDASHHTLNIESDEDSITLTLVPTNARPV